MSNVDERGFPVETISIASGLAERMKGLIGQSEKGGVVMLSPCCDIHTFGMRADLDVAFVSKSGVILESRRSVKPRTRIRCRGARAVLERFSDRRRPWFMNGDTYGSPAEMYVSVEDLTSCRQRAMRGSGLGRTVVSPFENGAR